MKKLAGKTFDVVFFPVDARLETAREWGVQGFMDQVTVRTCLIPMHYFGSPWTPSQRFKKTHGQTPLWIPVKSGEHTDL
jgi:putative SOS response-associated peptidase YedK